MRISLAELYPLPGPFSPQAATIKHATAMAKVSQKQHLTIVDAEKSAAPSQNGAGPRVNQHGCGMLIQSGGAATRHGASARQLPLIITMAGGAAGPAAPPSWMPF